MCSPHKYAQHIKIEHVQCKIQRLHKHNDRLQSRVHWIGQSNDKKGNVFHRKGVQVYRCTDKDFLVVTTIDISVPILIIQLY